MRAIDGQRSACSQSKYSPKCVPLSHSRPTYLPPLLAHNSPSFLPLRLPSPKVHRQSQPYLKPLWPEPKRGEGWRRRRGCTKERKRTMCAGTVDSPSWRRRGTRGSRGIPSVQIVWRPMQIFSIESKHLYCQRKVRQCLVLISSFMCQIVLPHFQWHCSKRLLLLAFHQVSNSYTTLLSWFSVKRTKSDGHYQ